MIAVIAGAPKIIVTKQIEDQKQIIFGVSDELAFCSFLAKDEWPHFSKESDIYVKSATVKTELEKQGYSKTDAECYTANVIIVSASEADIYIYGDIIYRFECMIESFDDAGLVYKELLSI